MPDVISADNLKELETAALRLFDAAVAEGVLTGTLAGDGARAGFVMGFGQGLMMTLGAVGALRAVVPDCDGN